MLTTVALLLLACETGGEEDIAISDLPTAIVEAIEAEWPGSELLEAEREDGLYEVEILTTKAERLEVELEEDGTIVDYEVEDDGDDDENEQEGEHED